MPYLYDGRFWVFDMSYVTMEWFGAGFYLNETPPSLSTGEQRKGQQQHTVSRQMHP